MRFPKPYRNVRPLLWFCVALALFLAVGVALSISRQRALLVEQLNDHIDREVAVIEAVITEDAITYNYSGIKHYLSAYAARSEDIFSIRAVGPNGVVLAEYSRPEPAMRPFKRTHGIKPGEPSSVTIELTHDLEPLHRTLIAMIWKNVAASLLFASAMAFFLWMVLKRTAFVPLQNALEGLNSANADLEQRVAARTTEWMQANTELKNEIAERVAAQQELMIKDRAIATSITGITLADFDGSITYANNASVAMWGYQDLGDVVGRSVLDYWESREDAVAALQKIRTLGSWSGELTARRKDNSLFNVQISAAIVKDAKEIPVCIMASIVDVTDRKQAEQRLRESEAKFKSFSEQAIVGIYVIQDDMFRYTNPRFLEMFGYGPDELPPDIHFRNLVHPEDRPQVEDRLSLRLQGKAPLNNYQFRGIKKNEETVYLEVYGAVITYEGRPAAIGTLLDITERVSAAEELRKSEAKHRMVVENISEIIYNMTLPDGGLQGTVDFLSGSVRQTVGHEISRFCAEPGLWRSLIHPDDIEAVQADTRRLVRDRTETTRFYRFRHGETGQYLWLEDRIVPQFDAKGTVIGYFGVARDITRRKQAEDALKDALVRAKEEKNKSEAIIAAIADGISIQDLDFRVLYQNEYHRAMIGNHVGELCYRGYHRRETVCPNCPVAQTFADGKVHTVEQTGVTDAGPVHVEITTSPLRDSSGTVVAGIEVVRNITDRKNSEQNVRISYETQSIINAILRISLEERSMEEVMANALDIVLSSSWYSALSKGALFLADDKGALVLTVERGSDPSRAEKCSRVEPGTCVCGRAAETGTIQFARHLDERHEIRSVDGAPHGHYCVPIMTAERTLGVLSLVLEDGHPFNASEQEFLSAVATALAGIIQRKRMAEERERMFVELQSLLLKVSASRQEWQETFDSITDMISIHDEEYRIVKANKAFAERFGLSPREVIQKRCYELFHNGSSPIVECPHKKTLERNAPVTEEVPDPGTGRMFLVSTFPFHSAESGKRGIVHIARDITEAKENETRLVMSERLAALGQLASGIAHEINNPLAAIAGCVDGMKRRIGRGEFDQDLFGKYLSIMKEELTRSKNITTSMLSFVQAKDYQKGPVKIHLILLKSLEIIGYQGRLKRVTVEKDLADGAPVVQGSEGELKQVFLIILTNALDAMDDQGSLSIRTSLQDSTVTITITDTGPGIAPENEGRIFQPFFTTKAERGGTGLGLSIAHRIMASHNARVSISSAAGCGTTVTLEFPLLAADKRPERQTGRNGSRA